MVEIIGGVLKFEESTKNAKGGTELQAFEMVKRLDPQLLKNFQIIFSRVREIDNTKKKILFLHDLPGDPENDHLKAGGYNKFDKLVFVSNWQMQAFVDEYSIPWYKCVVMQNAITPLKPRVAVQGKAKLIYHTTPHRGLNILLSVFDSVLKNNPNIDITLDVYSSFKIYGWEERNAQYQVLFDFCKNHPKINYFDSVSNEEVKAAISAADIFAYPSTWKETSCISLLEAMSAGLICVHPNLGALYETASNWTNMYQYQNNEKDHSKIFSMYLDSAVKLIAGGAVSTNQSAYINMFYNWDTRAYHWNYLLGSI
jgi:UDP-glucose:(glucosyl)LPS alpha-1,2-glucosyltransferase